MKSAEQGKEVVLTEVVVAVTLVKVVDDEVMGNMVI